MSRPGDWSPSHRLVSHATAPGRRATAVVVEADGVPLSGRRYVGVPGRIVAMGETRDVIGSALGRQSQRSPRRVNPPRGPYVPRPRLHQAARPSASRLVHAYISGD